MSWYRFDYHNLNFKQIKHLLITFSLLIGSYSLGQIKDNANSKPYYSKTSELRVFQENDSISDGFHSNRDPAFFVNGVFVGGTIKHSIILDQIESMNVEKGDFEQNGILYSGKIIITMKPEFVPDFITLKELFNKHLVLDMDPVVLQIGDRVISLDNEMLIDENSILKIIQEKIIVGENRSKINLIKLITRSTENIKKANTIWIRGSSPEEYFSN